jgi:hypothetical protein
MHFLQKPEVALAWDTPTNANSAGCTRFLLEQEFGYPVTVIRTRRLASAELEKFNVLILPNGGDYAAAIGKGGAERIKLWVRAGGTLITLGGASRWLTAEGVGLLATAAEDRDNAASKPAPAAATSRPAEEGKQDKRDEPFDYAKAIRPDKESPATTPGAILRARVDPEHWLAFGYGGDINVVTDSSTIFTPVKLDKGTNVAVYARRDELLLSGFSWDHALDQLAEKAYLVHQPHGRGHVVAFAEDPNVRAFADGLNLLLMNAVLLTAGR